MEKTEWFVSFTNSYIYSDILYLVSWDIHILPSHGSEAALHYEVYDSMDLHEYTTRTCSYPPFHDPNVLSVRILCIVTIA
jgi:hypothetical protein